MNLFFDSCAVERLAENNISAVEIRTLPFDLCYTPDLKREYLLKLQSNTTKEAKEITQMLLSAGTQLSFFGFSESNAKDPGPCLGFDEGIWASEAQLTCIDQIGTYVRRPDEIPRRRTDAYLVAFSQNALVITDNSNDPHWKRAPQGTGRVIFFSDLKNVLMTVRNLSEAFATFVTI